MAAERAGFAGDRLTAVIIAWTSADRGRGAARSGFFGPHEGFFRPRTGVGFWNGSRDRARQEGATGLRVRRHRHRALAANARPRRRGHLLDARSVPLRAAAAGLGDGRRGQPADGDRAQSPRRPRGAQPEGIWSRYEDAEERLAEIASAPPELATRKMQEIYEAPLQPELIAQRWRRSRPPARSPPAR